MSEGKGLELFVYFLYKDIGYQGVEFDHRLKKTNGQENARGQIDITYKKFFIRRYVECKYRSERNVDFDDYSKFETTLKTFNIPIIFGEIVTNTYFDEKVILRAKETGIKLIDKDALERLNSIRNSGKNLIFNMYNVLSVFEEKGFGKAIENFILKSRPIEHQIKYYEKNEKYYINLKQ
jgi:hypothetical protein